MGLPDQERRNRDSRRAGTRRHFVDDETITRVGENLEAPPGTEIIDGQRQVGFPRALSIPTCTSTSVHVDFRQRTRTKPAALPLWLAERPPISKCVARTATTMPCRVTSFVNPRRRERALAITPSTCRHQICEKRRLGSWRQVVADGDFVFQDFFFRTRISSA